VKHPQRSIHVRYDRGIQPHHRTIARLVSIYSHSDGSLLDIGCGVGHTLSEIRKIRHSMRLTAADIDEQCLQITQQRVGLQASILITQVEDLFEMQLTFETIVMSHSLEHMHRPVDTVRGGHGVAQPRRNTGIGSAQSSAADRHMAQHTQAELRQSWPCMCMGSIPLDELP